jgi:integrase
MPARHALLGGKVQVYQRPLTPHWHCSASVGGRQYRVSTKTDSLSQAKDFAEDWFLQLRGMHRFGGGIKVGRTFRDAAKKFLEEFEAITLGERSPAYVAQMEQKIRKHLLPYFGNKRLSEITPGLVQEYRAFRNTQPDVAEPEGDDDGDKKKAKKEAWTRPARTTIHHEIIAIRHVLKTANRHGWLEIVPDLSAPYKASGKIAHRAWFSPEEYTALYQATQERAKNPPHPKWRYECEQFHDFVLFAANTGLRPDEAANLQYRDVKIVDDQATGKRILEIEVRGKRGVGYCKSMPNAVRPFERLVKRNTPEPTDLVFGKLRARGKAQVVVLPFRELMNAVLDELGMKYDRDGQIRSAYSLRHTYICMRLMEGADIYQIAKNCRTSVEMIEKFYASHIKNTLDAAAINVIRARPDGPGGVGSKPKPGVQTGQTAPKKRRTPRAKKPVG